MYMSVRYNLRSAKDQAQARIDAAKEAARREQMRRRRTRAASVEAPTFRGAALELQSVPGQAFEVIISGPAETGKTFAACYLIDQLLRKYPGSQGVLARKIRDTLVPTVLQTYKKVAGRLGGVTPFGGQKPEWYDYDNGSRLWLAGLDKPSNALSSERDFIYVNQCEDLQLADWETLSTRATGRAGNAPLSLLLGDCNPMGKTHWIVNKKSIKLLRSFHRDNPTLFDDSGAITEQGEKTLAILSNLSEPRRSRLFMGLWASAEGQVYTEYDDTKHLIDRFDIPLDWPRIRVIDFGFKNAFVCAWYAYDKARNRLYWYREIYQTGVLVEDHAKHIGQLEGWEFDAASGIRTWIRPIAQRENVIATICDHDAEDRATLERHGIPNIPAFKAIKLGIEAVQARLKYRSNTKDYGLYFLRDSLVQEDPELKRYYLPTSTIEEFEGYIWEVGKDNKPAKDLPVDKLNHGMDTLRYVVAFVDDIGSELEETDQLMGYEENYEISPF